MTMMMVAMEDLLPTSFIMQISTVIWMAFQISSGVLVTEEKPAIAHLFDLPAALFVVVV